MDGNLTPKTNSKTILIIIAILAVVAIVAYFIWKNKKQGTKTATDGSRSFGTSSEGTAKTTIAKVESNQIQVGSKGDKVKLLQTYLNKTHSAGLEVDGIFGNGTKKAVEAANIPYPVKDSDLATATNNPVETIKKVTVDVVGNINKANGVILDAMTAGLFSKVKGLFS